VDTQSGTSLIWLVAFGGLVAFMFWSQWRARQRYRKRLEDLGVGDRVLTIGGIYGRLTYLDSVEGRARLEIASGTEVEIALGAISRRVDPAAGE
jgi:preprotein translocase subunit YajC